MHRTKNCAWHRARSAASLHYYYYCNYLPLLLMEQPRRQGQAWKPNHLARGSGSLPFTWLPPASPRTHPNLEASAAGGGPGSGSCPDP